MDVSGNSTSRGRKRGRKTLWKRVLIWGLVGLFLVLLISGGAFYLWFRSQVGAANADVDPAIIQALDENAGAGPAGSTSDSSSGGTADAAAAPDAPSGMNIVLLGADKLESEEGKAGRSDTVMLVHVDHENDFLSVLSVPRDLRVNVPGHGTEKMNAAYTYGGAALVIRTVQGELGVDLDHYVEVDFNAFKEITDTLGGVYMDVDRRYDDGKIQFAPGYQSLDGLNALRFVRTRHDTNLDFGRMQRQQRFISALREQAIGWNLPLKLPSLIKSLFGNVNTDLTANEIIKLAYWAIRLDGDRMRMATIVGDIETVDGVSYVLASDKEIGAAVQGFVTPPPTAGEDQDSSDDQVAPPPTSLKVVDLAGVSVDLINRSGRTGQAAFAALWLSRQEARVNSARDSRQALQGTEVAYPWGGQADAQLVAEALGIETVREVSSLDRVTVTLGMTYSIRAEQLASVAVTPALDGGLWSGLAKEVAFPLMAPSYIPATCSYSYYRGYDITVGDGSRPAFKVGYRYGDEDQYLCVNGTTWLDAPLASAGEEVQGDQVVFIVVGSNAKPERVWWKRGGVLYWVSNTLLYELSKEDLLAVAVSAVQGPHPLKARYSSLETRQVPVRSRALFRLASVPNPGAFRALSVGSALSPALRASETVCPHRRRQPVGQQDELLWRQPLRAHIRGQTETVDRFERTLPGYAQSRAERVGQRLAPLSEGRLDHLSQTLRVDGRQLPLRQSVEHHETRIHAWLRIEDGSRKRAHAHGPCVQLDPHGKHAVGFGPRGGRHALCHFSLDHDAVATQAR